MRFLWKLQYEITSSRPCEDLVTNVMRGRHERDEVSTRS